MIVLLVVPTTAKDVPPEQLPVVRPISIMTTLVTGGRWARDHIEVGKSQTQTRFRT